MRGLLNLFASISSGVSVNFSEEFVDFVVDLLVDLVVDFAFGLCAGLVDTVDFVWLADFANSTLTNPPHTIPTQTTKHKNLLAIIFYPNTQKTCQNLLRQKHKIKQAFVILLRGKIA